MHRADVPPRPRIVQLVGAWTRRTDGVRLLGALGFENAYAFAMRGDDARARGIATLDDLARQAPRLTLGSDLEFLERPAWARSEERRVGTEWVRTCRSRWSRST